MESSLLGYRGKYKAKSASTHAENVISPARPGDYQLLMHHLNEYSPGSKRNGRSRGSYQITRQESGHESVLNSRVASVPPYDQDLKIFSKLKSGEFDLENVDAYRKDLVQQTTRLHDTKAAKRMRYAPGSRVKTVPPKIKIGNAYRQHSQLELVMAELAHSPLNGDGDLPRDHVKVVDALRDLRFNPSAPPLTDLPLSAQPPLPRQDIPIEPTEESAGKNKYSLSADMSNPSGRPKPARRGTARRPVSSRSTDRRHKKSTRPDGWVGRVPVQGVGGGENGDISGKLPTRLRERVAQKFEEIVEYQHHSDSEATWRAIKRKHDKERSDRRAEGDRQQEAALARYDCEELVEMGLGDGSAERSLDEDVLVGVPSVAMDNECVDMIALDMMGLEEKGMEGLMSLEELEELSVCSGQSQDFVQDGSAAGLFGAESLAELQMDPGDTLLLEDPNSPEDVLAGCLGRLLFASDGMAVRVRPASAGMGGVSNGKIFSSPKASPASRPQSANVTQSVQSKLFAPSSYKAAVKRAVITRSRPASQWIS